jgi:hypothetical protein
MSDPRFLMAETYTMLKGKANLEDAFSEEINKVNSPEEAIELCLKYQLKLGELNGNVW